jgi:dolichol-phosphate mannosyltransferase
MLQPKGKERRSAQRPSEAHAPALELAVVVPTLNERDNIAPLVRAIKDALNGHACEIIVVDDNSPDGTADAVRELGRKDIRVRCIQRFGRRGLGSAFLEGALSTAAPVVALIDGDMQHDEKLLPAMLETLRSEDLDVVIGSRYMEQGGFGDWTDARIRSSQLATEIAKRMTGVPLSDPMSGFFMTRTELVRDLAPRLSAVGFKVLLDVFLTARTPLRFREIPYRFRSRQAGQSKMDMKVLLEFGELLIDKLFGRVVPAKLVMFALVGSFGVLVHLAVLSILFKWLSVDFGAAQTAATLTAMTANFALNNVITYHDRRLAGWAWIKGWLTFSLASSVGVVANVGVASVLFGAYDVQWIVSALAGILVGLLWNYVLTSVFTWKRA